MRSRQGFTLIELLVVIAIIAILASILFPVFAKAREKARQTTCTSQVRQLATAIQMYVQDNNSRYPGLEWHTAIENYAGSNKIYFCPSDAANDKNAGGNISYGYGGLLVRPDKTGCNEAQISSPTEVGAIADATPTRAWSDGGGLVGGGALTDPATVDANRAVELEPRHGGVIIGYCDGHAKFAPGKQINLKDVSNPAGRAFYQALGYGFVKNYGGGLQKIAKFASPLTTATVTLGGDFATMPLLEAAAEAWAGYGGKWYARGFKGATSPDKSRATASANYAWGVADGTGAGGSEQLIGYDAFVIIVSKNCKITNVTNAMSSALGVPDMTTANIGTTYNQFNGYSNTVIQAYTFDTYSGSRTYFTNSVGVAIPSLAVTVVDDLDMVEKVAADPYGMGYCSAAFCDPDKVQILAIGGKCYPNQNPKYRWLVPDTASQTQYPFIRTLKVQYGGIGGVAANQFSSVWAATADTEFLNGPLYKTSYFWTN